MRQRHFRLIAAAAAVPMLLGVAACSDDDGVPQSRDAMVSELGESLAAEDELGFDDDQADCIAAAVVDEVGYERMRDELEAVDGDFDAIDDEEILQAVGFAMLGAMSDCGADISGITGE